MALEESYKDQYQQIWDIAMDALTLLLDTFTPFWRNYGRTIGEDVQDFLIIPLYRNEFTGEAKRYAITGLPRRSFRHWLGLWTYFAVAILVYLVQVRIALITTSYYKLPFRFFDGFRWTLMPVYWIMLIFEWLLVLIGTFMVFTQIAVLGWWLGWVVKICA